MQTISYQLKKQQMPPVLANLVPNSGNKAYRFESIQWQLIPVPMFLMADEILKILTAQHQPIVNSYL